MKIAYVATGAGGMYCGTCLHDNTLAAALLRKKQQVALIPTYTPIRTDEESVSMDHIFYGGINVYLQQKSALFRHTPASFDELFNHPSLLKIVSRMSSSTDARDLGALTISVLKGEEGLQRKELMKLIDFLKKDYKPDLIHLNNSMFAGFAREMKRQTGVPVLCSITGEDLFLGEMKEPYKTEALAVLRERAADVDAFLSPSRYYAGLMSQFMAVPREKFHVVRLGLNLTGHGLQQSALAEEPFVIGYLARVCAEKGLHVLVEAFRLLAQKSDQVHLKIAGYLGKKDEPFWQELKTKLKDWGLADRTEFWGEVTREKKIEFLNQIHVLSVPTVYREPKGLYVLEAWANGVPVVQPQHGAFPELIEATGGGLLVEPNSPQALAEALWLLKNDPELRAHMGQRGKQAVLEMYSDDVMAEEALQVFRLYVTGSRNTPTIAL